MPTDHSLEILQRVTRIEEKLDQSADDVKDIRNVHRSMEERLRTVEVSMATNKVKLIALAAATAAAGGVSGALVNLIGG